MIYNVVISENAENDIKDIYNYIKYSLCAPKAAARIADLIEKQIMSFCSGTSGRAFFFSEFCCGMYSMRSSVM